MKPVYSLIAFLCFNQSALTAARFTVAMYAVHMQAPVAILGILLAMFSVGPMFGGIAMGKLVDRRGSRMPMISCALMIAVGAFIAVIWQNFWLLALSALLIGMGAFGMHVIMNTVIGAHSGPADRTANYSAQSMGVSAVNALTPYVAGVLIDRVGSYVLVFAILGALPLLAMLLLSRRNFPQTRPQSGRGTQDKKRRTFDLLLDPAVRSVLLVSVLFTLLFDLFAVVTPLHGSRLGYSAADIGLVVSAFSAASFGVRVVIAPLSRMFGLWRMQLAALTIAALGFMVFGSGTSLPVLLLCALAIGAGQGVGAPVSSTVLYEAAPRERVSEAMGLRTSLGMATHTALPLLIGAVGSFVGVAPILLIMGLLLLFSAWLLRDKWWETK